MPVDMSQFYGTFLKETQDHIEQLENLLATLSISEPDLDVLDSLYRAAHSIKGGSSVFGFDAFTSLALVMESMFDLVRTNEITLNKVSIEQLLSSVESLRNIQQRYENKEEIDWNVIEASIEALKIHLNDEVSSIPSTKLNDAKKSQEFFDIPLPDQDDDFVFNLFDPLDKD
jgi:two-component system chemotaxis sensor kinase CheA